MLNQKSITRNDILNNDKSIKQTIRRKKPKYKNVSLETQSSTKFNKKSERGHNSNSNRINDNETIDLTTENKKKITQSTLLVGSSLFKGIKNSDLHQVQLLDHFLEQELTL